MLMTTFLGEVSIEHIEVRVASAGLSPGIVSHRVERQAVVA